ncbi:MAG: Bug family tripartite tricarboxylate transporter substrate binding protein [Beijerinckiaceae bacterium]
MTVIRTLALLLASVSAAWGQSPAEFYKGKPVRMIIGAAVGGGYDLPGRVMQAHLSKHIPGNPPVVVENMPGAASLIMTNYLYNRAPRDGSVMGMPNNSVPLEPRLRILSRDGGDVRFDVSKFIWIGSPVQEPQILWTWSSAARNVEDLRTKRVVIGSMAVGADNYTLPFLANRILGTRMEIIPGYKGTSDTFVAAEQGEIQGGGTSLLNLMVNRGEWLRDGKAGFVLSFGLNRLPQLPDVPTAAELAESQSDRELFRFIAMKFAMSRPLAFPPETPQDRVDAMRRAFDETMKDPAFLADAKKIGLDVDPVSGVEIQKLVEEIQATPQHVVDRLRQLINAPK